MRSKTRSHSVWTLALFAAVIQLGCVSSTTKSASGATVIETDEKEVFVLGSLHSGMLGQPNYTLREFVGAIDSFRPDLIMTEVRAERPGPIEGSIDGGVEQSIVYGYGSLTNIPITPVDWLPNDFLDQVRAESAKESQALKQRVAPLNRLYEQQIRTAKFLEIQSARTSNLVRRIYTTYEKAGSTLSLKRNQKICENIKANLKLSKATRIAVVFGLDHKYFIEDCVKKAGAKLVRAESFLSEENLRSFVVPESLKEQSVTNIRASARYLNQEIERGKYKGAMKTQLQSKLGTFPMWIEAVNAL